MAAPGQDPLARGWTRGGEIYLWVAKAPCKTEHEIDWPPVAAMRDAAGGAEMRDTARRHAEARAASRHERTSQTAARSEEGDATEDGDATE